MKLLIVNSSLSFAEAKSPVEVKEYAYTTANDQYVSLKNLSAVKGCASNSAIVEVEAYLTSKSGSKGAIYSSAAGTIATKYATTVHADVTYSTVSETKVTATSEHLYTIMINSATGESSIDGSVFTSSPQSNTAGLQGYVFARVTGSGYQADTSIAGLWKLKSLKIKKASNGDVVADIIPATWNDEPCLYDKISKTALYPNSGTLAVE